MPYSHIDRADVEELLGINSNYLNYLEDTSGFPDSHEDDSWSLNEVYAWCGKSYTASYMSRAPLEYQRPARDPAPCRGPHRGNSGNIYIVWDTDAGKVLLSYGTGQHANPHKRCDDLPYDDIYAIVFVTTFIDGRIDPHLPELEVIYPNIPNRLLPDIYMSSSWPIVAANVGQKLPYFPELLRSQELLERWRPEVEPKVELPAVPDHEVSTLFMAAGLEFDPNSVVARTLLDLALARQGSAVRNAVRDVEKIEYADAEYCVQVAARPATLTNREYDDRRVDETDRRAAWMELFHREDEVAARCLKIGDILDSSSSFPYIQVHVFDAQKIRSMRTSRHHSVLDEWIGNLISSRRLAGHTRLEAVRSCESVNYLEDPKTGAPVVELISRNPLEKQHDIVTLVPERIPNTTELREIILEDSPWVRTADGELYLMPIPVRTTALSWGYGGHGPGALAATTEALLDDITSPGTRTEQGTYLTNLFNYQFPDGTVLNRERLLLARERPRQWGISKNLS